MTLLEESGEFILSNSGNGYHAFFFKGSESFTKRMINFCYNYGVTTGKVRKYEDGNYYVLAPIDRLKQGLLDLFRGEIILARNNINYKSWIDENEEAQVSWNEEKVNLMANDKLLEFWGTRLVMQNMIDYEKITAYCDEHNIGSYQDAEPEMITE